MRLIILATAAWLGLVSSTHAFDVNSLKRPVIFANGDVFMAPSEAFFEMLRRGCNTQTKDEAEKAVCNIMVRTIRIYADTVVEDVTYSTKLLHQGRKADSRSWFKTAKRHRKTMLETTGRFIKRFPDAKVFITETSMRRA